MGGLQAESAIRYQLSAEVDLIGFNDRTPELLETSTSRRGRHALQVQGWIELAENISFEPPKGVSVVVRDSDDLQVVMHPLCKCVLVDVIGAVGLGQNRAKRSAER